MMKIVLDWSGGFVALILMLATLAACGTERVQPRPARWPSLSAGQADCGNVLGRYIDPSASPISLDVTPGELGVDWNKFESASYVFGLHVEDPRFHNANRGRLTFTLAKNEADAIVVDFQIDDQTVASNVIPKSQWICAPHDLTMTVQERERASIDKVPGYAKTSHKVTMYRAGDTLYVESVSDASASLYGVIPWRSHEVYLNHYQSTP